MLMGVVAGCGGGSADVHEAAATKTATPRGTTATPSLSSLDRVACDQAATAISDVDDLVTSLRGGERMSTTIMAVVLRNASAKLDSTADAAEDADVKSSLQRLADADRLALEKVNAWRKGTLELAEEIQAITDAKVAALAACAG